MLSQKAKAIIDEWVERGGVLCSLYVQPPEWGGYVCVEDDDDWLSPILFRHYGVDAVFERDTQEAEAYLKQSQAEFRARYEDHQADFSWVWQTYDWDGRNNYIPRSHECHETQGAAVSLEDAQQQAVQDCQRRWSERADYVHWYGPLGKGVYRSCVQSGSGYSYGYIITPLKRPDQA